MKMEELLYYNGFGGFSKDGKEYITIVTNREKTPLPWSHLLVNSKIGTLVTNNGGGFSWFGNSRENKISTWCNDVTSDRPSEKILLEDNENCWSALSNEILEHESMKVIYGFGYATYRLESTRYEQEITTFVTENPTQKINILKIKNLYNKTRKLKIVYAIDVVLGVAKEYTQKHIVTEIHEDCLKFYNRYNNDYSDYALYCTILKFEQGNLEFYENKEYSGMSVEVELEPLEEKEIVLIMDYRKEGEKIHFENLGYYKQELEKVKNEWKKRLQKIQVTTPVDSINIILNGWMLYQTITSRIWGRASFYQSGGAYGFRDQLQDSLALLYVDTEIVRKQILYHAEHQFKEGDVLHWWHPERDNGIRTRFSDDLLWLVYVTCEYVFFTNDFNILWEDISFIEGRALQEDEDEVYIETQKSDNVATLLEHCLRAIERSLSFGEHGLPKMGSGDWNDGMNTVGGESVWLGFFIADILKKILILIKSSEFRESIKNIQNGKIKNSGEYKNIIEKIQEIKERYEEVWLELKRALDNAWDGRWFKRAYFESGEELGSNRNDECKIDNISQSWSVISGAVKKEKQQIAMESVENYLVDHENMIIKLLTPAFCNTRLEPGYIKSYIPGIRENGGQYTHGAIWAIIANCLLERNEVAIEYFRMLNPIEHTRTKEDTMKYKSEPYVIVADIYSHPHLLGRGGWSWYTGSASWYFVAGIKYILGLQKIGNYLEINPSIPKDWKNCYLKYCLEDTEFLINIEQVDEKHKKEKFIFLDNELITENRIPIVLDHKRHNIYIKIGK